MVSHHRRTCVALALVTVLVLVAVVVAACSAQASGTPSGSGEASAAATSSPADGSEAGAGPGAAKAGTNEDWDRIALALAWMQDNKPTKPVVVLLGGSAARECTVSDKSWRAQIVAKGGPETLAWNMGSHNRTMAQNLAIVKELPKDVPAIVYIGINLGSFTSPSKSATIRLPSTSPADGEWDLTQPHQYSRSKILTTAQKKAALQVWLSKRYPVFKANFSNNAAILARIIKYCKDAGYTPVLLELPRNSAVIGKALNAPTTKYREKCRQLAADNHVKWVPQLATLPNADFYDLWHLVEPGRTIWQAKLSVKTAGLLQ